MGHLVRGIKGLNVGGTSFPSATVQVNPTDASGELTRAQPGAAAECVSSLMDLDEQPQSVPSGHQPEHRTEGTDDE